jgi:L,D-transpeptidase ErfK/SrfK
MRKSIKFLCIGVFSYFSSQTLAATYPLVQGQDVVGHTFYHTVKGGESIDSISHKYDMSLHEILEANPSLNSGIAKLGQKVLIPARFILPKKEYRKKGGIVINVSELRLYYFAKDGSYVKTYPVALGRKGWRTPTLSATVVRKAVNPDWHVPNTIKRFHYNKYGKWLPSVIRGGSPENPLGAYAMYFSRPGILLHGTNYPKSIGKFVSSGCIRLSPQNVKELYHLVRPGARVYIVNHAHKAGWANGQLYLESHVPVASGQAKGPLNDSSYQKAIRQALGNRAVQVHWDRVQKIGGAKRGVPEPIGKIASR